MPQIITDPTDPNWGLSPAAASPEAPAVTRRAPTTPAIVDDPSDPNWGLERPPDFRVENEPPSPSLWEQAGTFAKEAWSQVNPITAAQGLVSAVVHPVDTTKALGAAQEEPLRKAQEAYQRGDYIGAAADFLYYMLPVIGPELSKRGHQLREGETAKGLGGTVGLAAGLLAPEAIKRVPAPTPRVSRLTPAEAAAVDFAQRRQIPLDVATATGSRTARAAQKRVASSMGGEGTAERLIRAQQEALTKTGGALTEAAAPGGYVSPEQAGAGIRESTRTLVSDLHAQATEAYGRLRDLETQHTTRAQTAPEGSKAFQQLHAKLTSGLGTGEVPTREALTVMRQLEAELEAMPFSQRRLQPARYGGSLEPVPGTGGAGTPVYHEILQAAPGTAEMTRGEVQAAIRKTLETGEWTNASRGAYEVAKQRLAQSGAVTGPTLPAGAPLLGTSEAVPLAINLTDTKRALQPVYDRLLRESELAPLMGGKADALRALDRLMSGPDVAPLSVVDAALGDLKTLARAEIPELRTQGQSIAAQAVQHLDRQVRARAAQAGPKVLTALEEGRGATIGKYQTAGVLEQLRTEPVQVYRQLTAPQDSAIGLLRQVREVAPGHIEKVGRAYLENLMTMATEEGGFGRAARLQAEWRKLGPETKKILFTDPGLRGELDHFFLLAKRMAENPNPSGTAHVNAVFNLLSQPVYWGVAKMLYTRLGVKAWSRLLAADLRLPQGATKSAGQTVATLNLLHAARQSGVEIPKAAERQLLLAQ
jgi:hypothetical protein